MAAEIFDFEDFFVDPADPGIEIIVKLRARTAEGVVDRDVPIRVRKGINLESAIAAKSRGVKVMYDLETGKPSDVQVDEAEVAAATLTQVILSWPFTRKGKPVPINEHFIKMMFGDNVETILNQIANYDAAKKAQLAPFENR